MPPTVKDAIEFIKSKDGLKNWTDYQIIEALNRAIKECAFTYTIGSDSKLDGIFIGYWEEPVKTIHAIYFAGKYKLFLKYLKDVFPTCKNITAIRFGKLKKYSI